MKMNIVDEYSKTKVNRLLKKNLAKQVHLKMFKQIFSALFFLLNLYNFFISLIKKQYCDNLFLFGWYLTSEN